MATLSAYIFGITVAIGLLIVAAICSNLIPYKPDNSDCKKRKSLFWIFAVLSLFLTFILTYAIEYTGIKAPSKQKAYMLAMCIASVVSPIVYIILGYLLAKTNKHGKIGNWF